MDMRLYNSSSAWFLAQIKPNCAKIADRNLKRQGFETFLPTEEETKQRRGQFVTTMRQMFPGYIFVAIDRTESRWQTVNSTYGVTRLVSFGDAPAVVPFDLISELSGWLLPVLIFWRSWGIVARAVSVRPACSDGP